MDDRLAKALVAHLDRIVHDVKSPINAVNGRLFLAARRAQGDGVKRNIVLAELGSRNLLRRMYNLYDVVSLDAGRNNLEASPEDLAGTLAEGLEFWRKLAAVEGKVFNISVPEGLKVKMHRTGFIRVVDNLVSNVFSHAEESTVVSFMSEIRGGVLRMTVRNDGIKRDPGSIDPVEPDFSEGVTINGLGLYCSKKMLESWGGGLAARVGAGGRAFLVELELVPVEE
ncbi:MAG: HAMP domain-containing histidine kinase [Planctomycetes bacterium]|nr:HAMP domain-containing histidine kinase [Planctomycetota bacterium]